MIRSRLVKLVVPLCLLAVLAAAAAPAQENPVRLAAPSAADTVRTNLWLVEALLGEAFHAAASGLPAAPSRVRLTPGTSDPADELARGVATRVLRGLGYEVYLAATDSTPALVDCELAFQVQETKLAYPTTDRTLGIWRRAVARHVAVAVQVDITAAQTGQVLFSERLRRSSADRFDGGDLDLVESDAYNFTMAPLGESGWQRRTEEIAVLATLAGLVAVYFANTGE